MYSWFNRFFSGSLDKGSSFSVIEMNETVSKEVKIGKKGIVSLKPFSEHKGSQFLYLRCRGRKNKLTPRDVTAQVHWDQEAKAPIKLYHDIAHQKMNAVVVPRLLLDSIAFEWLGFSYKDKEFSLYTQDDVLLSPHKVFYTHQFRKQISGRLDVHYQTLADHQIFVSPPGLVNGYPLWSYGGVLGHNGEIHLSEPLFFSVTLSDEDHTQIDLVRSSTLQEWGMAPLEGPLRYADQQIVLMEKNVGFETLSEVIAGGGIKLKMKEGQKESWLISSYLEVEENSSIFIITFIKQDLK